MWACRKHLENAISESLDRSDMSQARVRKVSPNDINVSHCETCDKVARYQVIPINFED